MKREKEDRERKERIELEDAFKKNSKTTISNEVKEKRERERGRGGEEGWEYDAEVTNMLS